MKNLNLGENVCREVSVFGYFVCYMVCTLFAVNLIVPHL